MIKIIENELIKEKVYIEKLESGFTIICIPKDNTKKKYAVCSVGYGSNYNKFIVQGENTITEIPDGVAHYLEHKMFEQESGINSLDTLSSLGVDANAYTTNDHTAYLFECTNNFNEALTELLSYVQTPYFTDENVEKERGIISQEINMYNDDPDWKAYINCMNALYKKNPIKIDIAGTIESIKKIDKETLYKCYNNFYIPSNMCLILVGDFEPATIIEKAKKQIKDNQKTKATILYEKEDMKINKEKIVEEMDVSIPILTLGIKVNPKEEETIKRCLGIEIILEVLFGNSSDCFKKLYEQGLIYDSIQTSFEWSKEEFAHIIIQLKTEEISKVKKHIIDTIKDFQNQGIEENKLERAKRKIYGLYVREFNDVSSEGTLFETNFIKGINPFEYLEKYRIISKEYIEGILKSVFRIDKMVESCIIPKKCVE